jgi:hypothetical protein
MTADPWEVFDYEADMFIEMCALLETGNPEYAALSPSLKNAVVESALLHTRQLIDIVLSRGRQPDDINLTCLLPGYQLPQIDELRNVYGNYSLNGSPCWTINKRLAHATSHRGSSYDYTTLLNQLVPIVSQIINEVRKHRRTRQIP